MRKILFFLLASLIFLNVINIYSQGYDISKFDGNSWKILGTGVHGFNGNAWLNAIVVDDSGHVYCGGAHIPWFVYVWDGIDWKACSSEPNYFNQHYIYSIIKDSNNNIYTTSTFVDSSDSDYRKWKTHDYIFKWDGTKWTKFATPIFTTTYNSNGFIGGDIFYDKKWNMISAFEEIKTTKNSDSILNCSVIKWNGKTWETIGTLATMHDLINVYSFATDSKNNLYVAGTSPDKTKPSSLVMWDGTVWKTIEKDNSQYPDKQSNTYKGITKIAFDNKDVLYAIGYFINDNEKNFIAKWDGKTWSELGGKYLSQFYDIEDIAVFDAEHIYATGYVTGDDGRYYIAKYNGTQWSNLWYSTGGGGKLGLDKYGNLYADGAYEEITGIEGITSNSVTVFPNPSNDLLTITLPEYVSDIQVQINNVLGNDVLHKMLSNNSSNVFLDVHNLSDGIYFVSINDRNRKNIFTTKVCVIH